MSGAEEGIIFKVHCFGLAHGPSLWSFHTWTHCITFFPTSLILSRTYFFHLSTHFLASSSPSLSSFFLFHSFLSLPFKKFSISIFLLLCLPNLSNSHQLKSCCTINSFMAIPKLEFILQLVLKSNPLDLLRLWWFPKMSLCTVVNVLPEGLCFNCLYRSMARCSLRKRKHASKSEDNSMTNNQQLEMNNTIWI